MGFPGSSDGKESACNVGDAGSIPGSGESPRGVNGNPLQYSCLENPMDRPWGCKELDTTERLRHTHAVVLHPGFNVRVLQNKEEKDYDPCPGGADILVEGHSHQQKRAC